MPWGAVNPWKDTDAKKMDARVGEETLGLVMAACALAAVDGRDLRYDWEYRSLQGSRVKNSGISLGENTDIKNVGLPGFNRAEQNFIAACRSRNGGSSDYDGANSQQVAALFGLCRDVAAAPHLPSAAGIAP